MSISELYAAVKAQCLFDPVPEEPKFDSVHQSSDPNTTNTETNLYENDSDENKTSMQIIAVDKLSDGNTETENETEPVVSEDR